MAPGKTMSVIAALLASFFPGTRPGTSEWSVPWMQAAQAAQSTTGPVDAVIRYHEFSSVSRSGVFGRAPGVDWGAPPPAFKSYPDASHVTLAHVSLDGRTLGTALRTPAPRTKRLRLDELGEMLYLAAGVTERHGGHALRSSPSAGGLFPSELYVVVRAIDGLPAGLYHYDAEHHRVDALGAVPATFGAPDADGADAVVLVSAMFRRTGYKYRDRTYRLTVADAGHLLENLRVAAHALGMQATPLAQFDEARAAKAIGVDGVEEGVLAVMDLRRATGDATPPGRPSREHFAAAQAPENTSIGVTGVVQRATSLHLVPEDVPSGAIPLPPSEAASRDAQDTIVHRRSMRRYSTEPVPLAALSSMLADMALPPQLSNAIRIHLVINRVAGLRPGVYRYVTGHRLVRVRDGDVAATAQSAALSQDVIGAAAVVLVLSVDRERMLEQGARGYRHAYLEAGMMSERWLLGAVARGLAACPVGAFYDDEAAALIGADTHHEWVLHFAALGIAAR